jgi:hypothetical protein
MKGYGAISALDVFEFGGGGCTKHTSQKYFAVFPRCVFDSSSLTWHDALDTGQQNKFCFEDQSTSSEANIAMIFLQKRMSLI